MTIQRLFTMALAGGIFAAFACAAGPVEARGDSGEPALTASPAAVAMADGKEVYTKKCKKCHGADGKAQTKMGAKHKIPDMTTSEWKGKWTKAKVVKVVTDGVKDTKMKSFKEKLSAAEIDAVSGYVTKL